MPISPLFRGINTQNYIYHTNTVSEQSQSLNYLSNSHSEESNQYDGFTIFSQMVLGSAIFVGTILASIKLSNSNFLKSFFHFGKVRSR